MEVASSGQLTTSTAQGERKVKAIRLKTEYLTDPIGIDYARPRLSWVCEGGKKQTAYRIIAKDDNENIIWDSGKTESSRMHLIPWGGESLESRQRVIWRVVLWDEKKKLSGQERICLHVVFTKVS